MSQHRFQLDAWERDFDEIVIALGCIDCAKTVANFDNDPTLLAVNEAAMAHIDESEISRVGDAPTASPLPVPSGRAHGKGAAATPAAAPKNNEGDNQ